MGRHFRPVEMFDLNFSTSVTRLKQARLIDYLVTLYVGARPDNGESDRPEIE